MSKKILLLLIAGAVVVIGAFLYFIIFRQKQSPTIPTKPLQILKAPSSPEKIFDDKILFPILSQNEQNLLYFSINDKKDLAFYQYSLNTKKEQKISLNMSVPDRVVWSPKRDKAILKVVYDKYVFEKTNSPFKDPALKDKEETTWFYDFNTKRLSRLSLNIQNIAWLPNGDQIIYHFFDPQKNINGIFAASPDGSGWRKLADIKFAEGIELSPISNEEIFYYPILTEGGGNNIYKLDLKTKQIAELIKNQTAGQVIASPSNTKIIYQIFHEKDQKYTLGTMNMDGSKKKDLGIDTEINKLVLSEKDDFVILALREEGKATDTFYKINLETNQKQEIKYKSDIPIDAKNLMLTKDGRTLYFTSDDYLYKMET
jgi:Tol biopolymer transport system component